MNGDSLMPQILKEEVKQEILKNALSSFVANGYKNTSMKNIAAASGISVGNIYNYFKDKETLYDALAMPVFNEIDKLFQTLPKNPMGGVDEKITQFIDIYKSNQKVFMMLMENSENTKFKNLKNTIIDNFAAAVERFRFAMTNKKSASETKVFLKAFACGFVSGIIEILAHDIDENLKLKVLQEYSSSMKRGLMEKMMNSRGAL